MRVFAAVLAAVLFLPATASAQMVCGDRGEIVSALRNIHDERNTAVGITSNGGLVELFAAKTRSWTLLLTFPGGPTCLLGSGEEWETWRAVAEPETRRG